MADGMRIPININLQQVRKAFREMGKLQDKAWKTRKKQIRVEEKAEKEELKRLKKEHATKMDFMKKEAHQSKRLRDDNSRFLKTEAAHTKKIRDEKGRFIKAEDQHAQRMVRRNETHVQRMNRAIKSGPLGRVGRAAGRTSAFAGGGILGLLIGYSLRAYQDFTSAHQSFGSAIGGGGSFGKIGPGANLGFNIAQRGAMVGPMQQATGVTQPLQMLQAMRATGMNQGQVGDIFSTMRAGGTRFAGSAEVMSPTGTTSTRQFKGSAGKEFKEILAAGMASGLERGRLPEYFKGVSQIMRQQQAQLAGDVKGTDIARIGALFGRTGLSGFQGQRGMDLMAKLQQGIVSPGGGESGKAFMQQAFGFGTRGTSFYGAEKQREKGLTSGNFSSVMKELTSQYGTGQDAALKMREVFGVSLEQAEELIKLNASGEATKETLEQVDKIMEESKSLEEQALEQMKKSSSYLPRLAGKFDESVAHGAKVAPAIEAVEDAMRKMFDWLITEIPKLMKDIVPVLKDGFAWLKDRFGMVDDVKDFITGGGTKAAGTAAKNLLKGSGIGPYGDLPLPKLEALRLRGNEEAITEFERRENALEGVRDKWGPDSKIRKLATKAASLARWNTIIGDSLKKRIGKKNLTEGEASWIANKARQISKQVVSEDGTFDATAKDTLEQSAVQEFQIQKPSLPKRMPLRQGGGGAAPAPVQDKPEGGASLDVQNDGRRFGGVFELRSTDPGYNNRHNPVARTKARVDGSGVA